MEAITMGARAKQTVRPCLVEHAAKKALPPGELSAIAATTDRGRGAGRTVLSFRTRGVRRKKGYGLYYASLCGEYLLYKSDRVAGCPVSPPRYLAIKAQPFERVISRHWSRSAAIKACRDDQSAALVKGAKR